VEGRGVWAKIFEGGKMSVQKRVTLYLNKCWKDWGKWGMWGVFTRFFEGFFSDIKRGKRGVGGGDGRGISWGNG